MGRRMSYNNVNLTAKLESRDAIQRSRIMNPLREHRYVLITLACGVLGVIAVYVFTKSQELLSGLAPVFVALGAVLVLAAVRDWEFGLKALLVLVIVEGAVRKWFLPSASE